MAHSDALNRRIRETGDEIFERAFAAEPSFWHKAWWLERMTRFVDRDEALKKRAFLFVDCLPALKRNAALVRHLEEYLDAPGVGLPRLAKAMIRRTARQGEASMAASLVARLARWSAQQMAGRFIAGFDVGSTLDTITRLRNRGMAFTLDVLGEATTSYAQADCYARAYTELIDHLAPVAAAWPDNPLLDRDALGPMPRINVSLKLTGFDPWFSAIDPDRAVRVARRRLVPLLRRARAVGAFVNFDSEQFRYRTLNFNVVKHLLMEDEFRDWADVGFVVQAYLRDSARDLADLIEWGRRRGTGFAVRLVKGAYWDAETTVAVRNRAVPPVWTRKWESDVQYETLAAVMLDHRDVVRPAFASHNVRSLACVLALAEQRRIQPHEFEVQMLYGMGDPLKAAMVQMGRCLRVYCPCGDLVQGMAYLIRRLLENTSNDSFLKQGFGNRAAHPRLLMDPDLARQPSAPLPSRNYQNTDLEEPMTAFSNASPTDFGQERHRATMREALQIVRNDRSLVCPVIIRGQSVATDDWFPSVNPARPSEVIGRVAQSTIRHVDQAATAARQAFSSWSRTTASQRAQMLHRVADLMEAQRFELAATMVLEVGKPWREADGDVVEAIDFCRFYAEEIALLERRPRRRDTPGEHNVLLYAPIGVVAVIGPYNFPLAILAGMTAAALAAGNCVLMKPARVASVTASRFMRLLMQAGIPEGAVALLPGEGATTGRQLVAHEEVDLVVFTGTTATGADVIRCATAQKPGTRYTRQTLVQLGGKNAIIVDDDADLDAAAQAVIESAFAFAGQRCSSCSRVIVVEDVREEFLTRLTEAVESLPIGLPETPSTLVGPVVDDRRQRRIEAFVEEGRRTARLRVQAPLPPECGEGYFVRPVLFDQVDPASPLAQEEIGGPVLAALSARDFDEALALANGTRYALTGGLYSRSPRHIEQARREFLVGNLYINRKVTGAQVDVQPFGGFRDSGPGVKIGSRDYLLRFLHARCIAENTLRSGLVADPAEAHPVV